MSEKKFLSCVLTEGILLMSLGLGMLMLPKITSITFGLTICIAFVTYGGYKVINAFMSRNYTRHYILNIVNGAILFLSGIFLFMFPLFNLVFITSVLGIYFILEGISSTAFAIQNRNTLYLWQTNVLSAVLQLLIGLIIIIGLPSTALWVIGMLAGINFLFSGIMLITMFIGTKYAH